MSYIRLSEDREWTDGNPMYVYPDGSGVYAQIPGWHVSSEDWVEVTMRMLERSGEFDVDTLDAVFNALADQTYLDEDPGGF